MSYRCAECNSVHYGKSLSIVTDIKQVDYVRSKVYFDRQEKKHKPVFDSKSEGWEISKKVNVCAKCFEDKKEIEPNVACQKTVNFFIKNDSNKDFKIGDKPVVKQHTNRHNRATRREHRSNWDTDYKDRN